MSQFLSYKGGNHSGIYNSPRNGCQQMSTGPVPELEGLIKAIGQAGKRLTEIDAAEAGAGNISVCILSGGFDVAPRFPDSEEVLLPFSVPELAGATFSVTGSATRLRDVLDDPEGNLGCLVIQPGGETAFLRTSPRRQFTKVTSEFNSHLAIHYDRLVRGEVVHAVIHAQPPHLIYLSHIAAYRDQDYLNQHLLRWQPETIIQMPEGLGVVPFLVPGSSQLVDATREALQGHQLAVWCRHGVICRADGSVMHACDLIEYAEAAARYEYLNLAAGEPSHGLSVEEIRAICESVGVTQTIF